MNKRNVFLISVSFGLAIFLFGCIGNIIGTNLRQPKEGQAGTYSRIFDCPYSACFEETQNIITQGLKATINRRNPKKGIISALNFNSFYRNCISTTEIMIFLEKIETEKTKIVIASGNYSLAETVSAEIFASLEKKFPQKK